MAIKKINYIYICKCFQDLVTEQGKMQNNLHMLPFFKKRRNIQLHAYICIEFSGTICKKLITMVAWHRRRRLETEKRFNFHCISFRTIFSDMCVYYLVFKLMLQYFGRKMFNELREDIFIGNIKNCKKIPSWYRNNRKCNIVIVISTDIYLMFLIFSKHLSSLILHFILTLFL